MQVIGDNILQGRTQRLDRLNDILKVKQPGNYHSSGLGDSRLVSRETKSR